MANPASVARWEFENLRDGIESRLDHMATKEDLERFATKEDLNEALVPIYRHLGDLDKKVDAIPGIVARLDGVDARLDGIDARLDGIDTRLEVIESGISGIMDYLINRSDD